MTRNLIARIAIHRPAKLFVAADAAQPGDRAMAERVEATLRAVHEAVDWPCQLEINAASEPLGCTNRVNSAIDETFVEVDQAVILEDDLDPHPGFFLWVGEMLDRYAERADVGQVTGLNLLGHWDAGEHCHALAYVSGTPGFATWRRSWRAARALTREQLAGTLAAQEHTKRDHLLGCYLAGLIDQVSKPSPAWDTDWEVRRAALSLLTVAPTRNLMGNLGSDSAALHPLRADSLHRILPAEAPEPSTVGHLPPGEELRLTRLTLLLLLVNRMIRPDVLSLLARCKRVSDEKLAHANELAHHLLPFTAPRDTADALHHLARAGAPLGATLSHALAVFEREAERAELGDAPSNTVVPI